MSKASRECKEYIKDYNRWIRDAAKQSPRSEMTLSSYRTSRRNEQIERKQVRHLWLDEYSRLVHRDTETRYFQEVYSGDWKSAYRRKR